MRTEIVSTFHQEILRDILLIKRGSFPEAWLYPDAEAYYGRMLRLPKNINILLKDADKNVGFLLAIPQNDAVRELINDDPEMEEDPSACYIETVGILPAYQKKKGLAALMEALITECRKRGLTKISLHARVNNHVNEIMQKKYGAVVLRRIARWAYCNDEEPVDYLEMALPNL